MSDLSTASSHLEQVAADVQEEIKCDDENDESSSVEQQPPWPEDKVDGSVWSLRRLAWPDALFYSYMGPILAHGAKLHRKRKALHEKIDWQEIQELSKKDVYAVPRSMESQFLARAFWQAQQPDRHRSDRYLSNGRKYDRYLSNGQVDNREAAQEPDQLDAPVRPSIISFLRVLWAIAKPTYVAAGVWQGVATICQCSLPLLVREVLVRLEAHPGQPFRQEGLVLAGVIFLVNLLDAVGNERQKFLSFRTGITLRSAVVAAAHGHVLALSPTGRAGLSAGEITNLVAVDAQKLFELAQEGHYAWSCPLAMVIVSALLLWEMGLPAVVGIVSMFLIVPLVQLVVARMMLIRKQRVAAADRRVEATSAMLQGVRFAKLNRYEQRFIDRVMSLRAKEVSLLRWELAYLSLTIFATVISPVLASGLTFITFTLLHPDNVLTPSLTFTSLFLFAALRFPINYAGKLMGKAAQGIHACSRFARFFARDATPAFQPNTLSTNQATNTAVIQNQLMDKPASQNHFVGASEPPLIDIDTSFTVGDPSGVSFTLSDIQLTVRRSQITCVVGPVASGKSTLVQGLIGELLPSSTFHVRGNVSYASQVPFILNATIRDNILFGAPLDRHRYQRVLEACCLLDDMDQFHSRDLTQIGERGVTLSGGQKQRVSLARVAYSQPDVAVLDDPLSALDAATGKKVFEQLFRPSGGNGLFASTAVVLVTHASHFLHRVDSIIVLVNGKSAFHGSWKELASCRPTDSAELDAIEAIRSAVQEDHTDSQPPPPQQMKLTQSNAKQGRIMTEEERKYGLSQLSTWLNWFAFAGGVPFFIIVLIVMALDRFLYVATEWWLASWTQGLNQSIERFGRTFPPQTDGIDAQLQYVTTYLIILGISMAMTLLRTNWVIQGGARCASRLFVLMLDKVLYAPMSYFDTTPFGRIMNRFTYDTECLDVTLTMSMTVLMTSLGWFFTGIILQSIILPWQLVTLFVIILMYWLLLLHYRKSAVDLQRLDATSRSPVQAQLAEAIDGTSTIRVFGKSSYFSSVFRRSLDENSGMMMNFMAAHRWLSVRIQMLGACAVLFSVGFVVSFNDILRLDPGIAAMLIIWSANFTITLSFMVQGISESEAALTSLERVVAMTEIPQEEDAPRESSVDPEWPSAGDLTFEKVTLRYRPGLPVSLDGLTFALKSGQRCGVVGRTGAGKSTLAAALFRLVEVESGKITLNGVDLSKIRLADVRGRKNCMTIIPQEPVLFAGTLKQCLDPFGDFSDEEILDALASVRGASRGFENIDIVVEEGGKNFSVGERQLICLGRAMLAKPKLLFLDEATASVDGETDALIQKMLRSRFVGTTLLTIAHRLNTIMDYDVILVVDKGKAAEFGTPAELLSNEHGIFTQLVDSTGKESAAALRSMVFDTNI